MFEKSKLLKFQINQFAWKIKFQIEEDEEKAKKNEI